MIVVDYLQYSEHTSLNVTLEIEILRRALTGGYLNGAKCKRLEGEESTIPEVIGRLRGHHSHQVLQPDSETSVVVVAGFIRQNHPLLNIKQTLQLNCIIGSH